MHKTRVNALVRERTKDLKKDTEHLKNELQGLKVMFETSRENRGKTLSSGIWRSGKNGPIINYAKNIYGKEDTKFDPMNFENVKFLKYENSQNLDAKISTIPKEQRALKEFIKQSKNSKKKPSIKGAKCGQCEEKVANVGCVECGEEYCASCFVVFHLKGNLKKHRSRPIGVENLRTLRPDVMERNITNFHDDKSFKEMGPGTEQLSSIPHLRIRTRSNCSEVSTNDSSNMELLKDGNFNEEESSLSFQRALNSWRASNHGSGDSKDVLMPNRNVRAAPSQEIAVGTASPSVVSNLDDMMQDLEKKIQETSSLAYSDKLMLKKLRRREFSTSFTDVPKSNISIASILSDVHEAKENLFGKNNFILKSKDAMHSSSSNLTDILESFVNKKESNDDDDDDDDTSSNKQKMYTEDNNKSDNHDNFDDGDRMRRSSHVTIEDMHPSVPTPRNFSTKIKQNVKKCDQSDKFLDARVLSDFDVASKEDAKNMNENKNINNKMKKNKVEMNQKTRKIPKKVNVESSEFNLNLTEDYSYDKTPASSSRTSGSSRSTKNLNSSNKTSSRTTNRLMSARLAGERGGFTRKLSEAVSNIANMEVDNAILVDTSLDDYYMAGLPSIEGCHGDEDRQQTDTNRRVSARICVDGNSKEGSKISNCFYQIKRKMWKPKSDYSQSDDDDEMMRNVKEAMKQIDDNRNDYDNFDDDDDDDDDDIRLEVKLSNNIENNNLSSLAISDNLSDDKKLDKCDLPITDNSDSNHSEHERTSSTFISEEEMIMKFYNSVRQETNAKEVTNFNPKQGFDKESSGFAKDGLCLNPNSRQVTTSSSSKNNFFEMNISSSSSSSSPSFLRKFSPKYLKTSNSPSPNSRQSRVVPPLCVTGRSMTSITPPLGKCSSNEMFHGDCLEDKFDKNYTEQGHDKIMKVHSVDCASSSSLTLGYDDDDLDNDNGDEEEDEDGFGRTSSMISNNKGSLCDVRGSVVRSHLDSRRLSRDIIDDGHQSTRHLQRIDNFNDLNVSFADQESEDIKAVLSLS